MKQKRILTYEEAREYIAGPEKFDYIEDRIEHVKRLDKSVRQHLIEHPLTTEYHKNNLIRTVTHYIERNKKIPNVYILENLLSEIIEKKVDNK